MLEVNNSAAALLSVLRGGPKSHAELHRTIIDRFGSFFTPGRNTTWRTLHDQLVPAGLVNTHGENVAKVRYAITPAGRTAFRRWLRGNPEPDRIRSPLMLWVLHANMLTPALRQALIDQARTTYGARLTQAKTAVKHAPDLYARAVAEYTVDYLKAMCRLLKAIPA